MPSGKKELRISKKAVNAARPSDSATVGWTPRVCNVVEYVAWGTREVVDVGRGWKERRSHSHVHLGNGVILQVLVIVIVR